MGVFPRKLLTYLWWQLLQEFILSLHPFLCQSKQCLEARICVQNHVKTGQKTQGFNVNSIFCQIMTYFWFKRMLQTQTINGQTQGVSVWLWNMEFKLVIFIDFQSFIFHFMGLLQTKKMSSSHFYGLLFQLAEHSTGILEVMNLLSSGLDFFSLYFHHCLSTLHHCKDHSHLY